LAGEFEDNSRMEVLDVLFAKRFIDANEDWKHAGEYHADLDKDFQIQDRDHNISKLAQKLISPGKFLSLLVKIVAFAEWKSVSRTIGQLDTLARNG
jgi:hypothetical protein